MSLSTRKTIFNTISTVGLIASIAISIYFIHLGVFRDPEILKGLVGNSIVLGPLIFIFVQILQVVIPIIPGGITNAAGVLMFGPVFGFIYNYVGNVVGSLILFGIGRKYGRPFIETVVSEKTYTKYADKLNNKKWDVIFTLLIASPIAPDDALVLLTSMTKMKFKKFALIILLAKPFTVLAYSLILVYGGQYITDFFFK
jgi:uncharacterized membrane protein YdjX (TVP38/TMEM64 family)